MKILIKTETDEYVHIERGLNSYTLCGLETDGDSALGIEAAQTTTRRVDCPQCISTIVFCKSIPARDYQNPK